MLEVKNGYDEAVTIIGRHIPTGNDGLAFTIEAGETAQIEIDGDTQVVVSSTRNLEPGTPPTLKSAPTATLVDDALLGDGDDTLSGSDGDDTISGSSSGTEDVERLVASDEDVTEILAAMRSEKTHLTRTGLPELAEVNARLATAGLEPIKADRRDALFATLPAE